MDSQLGFLLKVFIGSALLSAVVKYGGRLVPIAPSNLNAAIAITLPSAVFLVVFWWRRQH